MAIKTNLPQYGNIFFQGETFDDLRSISPAKIRDGYSAIVRGQTATADGLGGLYAWKPTSTAPDDGETVLAPAAGGEGRWVKLAVGQTGPTGSSAYQAWLARGNSGTEADFIAALKGATGDTGSSAYEAWLARGNSGTEAQFIAALKGATGDKGDPGGNVMSVGPADQVSNLTIPTGVDYLITSAARTGRHEGGARFRVSADQSAPAQLFTRLRTSNGRFFDLDETSPTLYQFGAFGDETNDTENIQRALDYAGSHHCAIEVPMGIFSHNNDIRALGSGGKVIGTGGRIAARNSSRFFVGDSANFGAEDKGQKAFNWTFDRVSLKPYNDHDGPVLILDFCDFTEIRNCDIGSFDFSKDKNAFQIGVETRYVQWLWLKYNLINVNGKCINIVLSKVDGHNENEDHFYLEKNFLYVGKALYNNNQRQACISVDHQTTRSHFAGMFYFVAVNNHFYRNEDADVSGLLLFNFSGGTVRSLHKAVFRDNFFENITYCYDRQNEQFGSSDDSSVILASGNSYLNVAGKTGTTHGFIYGDKELRGKYILEGELGAQGVAVGNRARISFGMGNEFGSFTTLQGDFMQSWRFADKEGGSLRFNEADFRAASAGKVTIKSGQTSVTITHAITHYDYQSKVPDNTFYRAYVMGSSNLAYVASEDRSAGTVTFNFADPTQDAILYWTAESPMG